jgi:hypothetical protein
MNGDLTAEPNTRHDTGTARAGSPEGSWRSSRLAAALARLLGAAALGALLFALAAQLPVTHAVDVGGYDAAYVQGFHDPERTDQPGERPYLAGSSGAARWSRAVSYLLFPQAGQPAEVTLRLRGWRADGPAPEVRVLLNGATELGRFRAAPEWEERTFAITGELLKPSDVVLEIRSETATLGGDRRAVGVLLDGATYRAGPPPILPYPAQLAYGAFTGAMLYALLGRRPAPTVHARSFVLGLLAIALAYLALYRLQPPYPYPLRQLPQTICLALAALLAIRHGPALARRAPALLDLATLAAIGAWTAALLAASREHLVLSVPGVEKDFRVFATRAFDLGEVFRADGFYNLGYPLLLWLTTPLAQGNPFLAARLVAALSAATMLVATWWLARMLLGRAAALLAVATLALSPLAVQYALYVGSDAPFAALCTLALALLLAGRSPSADHQTPQAGPPAAGDRVHPLLSGSVWLALAAGLVAGAAFLVRHPGLLLLPLGVLALLVGQLPTPRGLRAGWRQFVARSDARPAAVYALAFCLAILPQVAVNLRDTGQPLYSEQAKNIWLAVYGDGDWGRWGEARDDISLAQVALQDPGRFLGSWWANIRAFFGTGAEDTGEFGRATQLRLLGFPANWLAVAGLLAFGVSLLRSWIRDERLTPTPGARPHTWPLLAWVGLYVAAVSVGLSLPRFFLPLAPIYAVAAAWALLWVSRQRRVAGEPEPTRRLIAIGVLLMALLWGGFATGTSYVLRTQPDPETPGQTAETLAAARLVQETLRPGERLLVRTAPGDEAGLALAKYSAIAHLAVLEPASDDPAALAAAGAHYLLWSSELGEAPTGERVESAGRYTLVRLN